MKRKNEEISPPPRDTVAPKRVRVSVPSLFDLALAAQAKHATRLYRSHRARHLAASRDIVNPDVQELVVQEEKAHIEARGRIYQPDTTTSAPLRWSPAVNARGIVDGAHFRGFDPSSREVLLRVDHSTHPDFWLELTFTLDQLEEFCGWWTTDDGSSQD